ncbi:hypothetical protein SH139x_002221 [Planctomycetaceae bacterium SH139]
MENESEPKFALPILLPTLSDDELKGLIAWVVRKHTQGRYKPFVDWIGLMLQGECARRDGHAIEPAMWDVPTWSPAEASQALMAAYVFANIGLTENQAKFVDTVFRYVLVDAVSLLDTLEHMFNDVVETQGSETL